MDIQALVTQDLSTTTAQVVLERDEDGNPKAGLLIVGMDSPQYQEEDMRQRVAANMRRQQAEKDDQKVDVKTEDGLRIVLNQTNINARDRLLAVTVGWFGMTKNGEEAPFDKEVVRKLYERNSIAEAALNVLGVDSNFLPKSSETPVESTPVNSRGSTRGKKQSA